jgi:mRNA-degrading endonuclease YafQ of YafQ-DinJ toxin-antitoxin module
MNITTLTRLVFGLTTLLIMLSVLLFLQNNHYIPNLGTLYSQFKKELFSHEINSLQRLYKANTDKKPVQVALPLDTESIQRTMQGLKFHLNTVLDIQKVDGNIVKYILQIPENGKQHFTIDTKTHQLKGAFKTFKHTADDGTIVFKLVPVNPAWVKGS